MATFTSEQRLSRAAMAIMKDPAWAALSGLIMMGKTEVRADIPTACTNGRDEMYGDEFVKGLTDPEVRFLRIHEAMHKGYRHLTVYKHLNKVNSRVANMAMDYVINIMIQDDADPAFAAMPKGGLVDAKYRGWNTQQVFDDLMKNAEDEEPEGGGGAGGFDEHDWDGAEALSADEQKTLARDVEIAVRQGALTAGKERGSSVRGLADALESSIPWREVLAEFVKTFTKGKDSSSWAKVNRRWVAQGMYLPSAVSDAVGNLLIGIDASGSTWMGNQLEGFVGELAAICNDCAPESVDIVWWDYAVTSVQSFKMGEYDTMLDKLDIKGGGGTRPSCVTEWVEANKKEYVAAVMLSDGLVGNDWGHWGELPVLWCLNTQGITAPVGQTLYIK